MKKIIDKLEATSNGKFVEFYTWDDLTKSEQNYQLEFANYDQDNDTDLITGNFIKANNQVYYLGDFIMTNSSWVSLPDYAVNDLCGVHYDNYNLAIEINDNDGSYRIWHIRE